MNRATPERKTRFRPSMSPSVPAISTTLASVRAYASTTHWRSVNEAWSSFWMSGSATFTTVMSSRSMKIADADDDQGAPFPVHAGEPTRAGATASHPADS